MYSSDMARLTHKQTNEQNMNKPNKQRPNGALESVYVLRRHRSCRDYYYYYY